MKPLLPDFRSPDVLREQAVRTLAFYGDQRLDPSGGFRQMPLSGGADDGMRHLIGSARAASMYAKAAHHFATHPAAAAWRDAAAHALAFLREAHRDPGSGDYAWLLRWDGRSARLLDTTVRCEGLAWVLMAHAHALRIGLGSARSGIGQAFMQMEQQCWQPTASLYVDNVAADEALSVHDSHRVSVLACEALLAAHDATADARYLQRAALVADNVVQWLLQEYARGGEWKIDTADSLDLHPTGHLARWARLLIAIERSMPEPAEGGPRIHQARELFAVVAERAWDRQHCGLVHTISSEGAVQDGTKYAWVQSEGVSASAALAERTAEGHYWDWYDRLWAECWTHFIDHDTGAWQRMLSASHRPVAPTHPTDHDLIDATGYHAMDTYCESMAALTRQP